MHLYARVCTNISVTMVTRMSMYVCACKWMYGCIYEYVYIHTHVCICIYMSACVSLCGCTVLIYV